MNAIEKAVEAAGFGQFARALHTSGFGAELESGQAYTIFAPTDDAFAKLPKRALQRLLNADNALLRAVVTYHLAAGKVMASRFAGTYIRAVTCGGQTLAIDGRKGLRVNGASLVRPDISVGASIMHGIDSVLWPKETAKTVAA